MIRTFTMFAVVMVVLVATLVPAHAQAYRQPNPGYAVANEADYGTSRYNHGELWYRNRANENCGGSQYGYGYDYPRRDYGYRRDSGNTTLAVIAGGIAGYFIGRGSERVVVLCPNCRQECGREANFCGKCGAQLRALPKPQNAPQAPQGAPAEGGWSPR